MESVAGSNEGRLRPVVLNHLVLAISLVTWRAIENSPTTAAATGGTFAASVPGRALAIAAVLGSVIAIGGVAITTWRTRRDARAWILCAALAAALAARRTIDVFDIVYVALVSIAAALVLVARRD